jgi:hypothetical protein
MWNPVDVPARDLWALLPESGPDTTGRPGHRIGAPIGWIVLIASAFGRARPLLAPAPGTRPVRRSGICLRASGYGHGPWPLVRRDQGLLPRLRPNIAC